MKTRYLKSGFVVVVLLLLFGLCQNQLTMASEEQFLYDSHKRRDPFIPLVGPGAQTLGEQPSLALSSIKLEGIVVDPEQGSFVMVDGEMYQKGEKIGPYLIEKIEENRVTLKYNDKSYELALNEEED